MQFDVLLVQHDPEQRAFIREVLETRGHKVAESGSIETARRSVGSVLPDAVIVQWTTPAAARSILDMLPARNGHAGPSAIVTASPAKLTDAVSALAMGYDDCWRMPVEVVELLARLDASIKRRITPQTEQLCAGPMVLDKAVHSLSVNDEVLDLAPTEFRLLAFFLENPDKVFSRNEILKRAWHRKITTGSRTVDVHVRRLRRILAPYHCDKMIQTVRSFGYRFRPQA